MVGCRFCGRTEAPNKTHILDTIFEGYDKRVRPHYRGKEDIVFIFLNNDSINLFTRTICTHLSVILQKAMLIKAGSRNKYINNEQMKWTSIFTYFYAPVKVNSEPTLQPGTRGALVGLYLHIDSSLSPQYVGDSRILSLLCTGMWNISREFVLIQDGGHRSCKDFWVHFRRMRSLKTADAGVNRYLWSPFYCYSKLQI